MTFTFTLWPKKSWIIFFKITNADHVDIIMQIMLKVFILGYIYAHPAYRDLMRAEGPKHIPIF